MSVLSGPEIVRIVELTRRVRELADGDGVKEYYQRHGPLIEIEPFDPELAGPNSYDIHLAPEFRVYALESVRKLADQNLRDPDVPPDTTLSRAVLNYRGDWVRGVDVHRPTPTIDLPMPAGGMWLYPGILYLAATVERTLCCGLVPWLDGRSSVGRAGLSVHVTAGRGDDGFGSGLDGGCSWTLEMTAVTHPVKVYPNMRIAQLTFMSLTGQRKPYVGRYSQQDGPVASRFYEQIKPND